LPKTIKAADGSDKPRESLAFHEYYRLDDALPGGSTRRKQLDAKPCTGGECPNATVPERKSDAPCDVYRVTTAAEKKAIEEGYTTRAQHTLRELHKVPKAKGVFKAMRSATDTEKFTKLTKAQFDAFGDEDKNTVVKLDHTTPRAAGGCPSSANNTKSHYWKCANCRAVDGLLDSWSNQELTARRAALGV
jgi:hypothetical protein